MSYNRIYLIGNAGTDPEMRYTPNGNAVTSFRLAVTRRFGGDNGEQREETEWFTVQCWNRQAESVNQYLTKGKKVFVEGRFRSRSYTANDGTPRNVNEVQDARVLFLDRPSQPAPEGGEPAAQGAEQQGDRGAPAPRRRVGGTTGGAGGDRKGNGEEVEELPW
jgi:single-strand DNA-binding protein